MGADKLIMLTEGKGVTNTRGKVLTNVIPREVEVLLARRKNMPEELVQQLNHAVKACRGGVKRTHLIGRHMDGALLKELFTRNGAGTLLTAEPYEEIRNARIDDIGGILELLGPLEAEGTLVRRSRDLLETEIERFTVVELDGMIIGCASLHTYPQDRIAELAGVAVHSDYRNSGRGDALLEHMEKRALASGIDRLFVLTTQTAHWFRERGFLPSQVSTLPMAKREMYNYQRNSKVFIKGL
jgi:amino-acid N-acetyltransferase